MSNLRLKLVGRRDTIQGHFRLFRVMWETGNVGDGLGYSNQVSVALTPRLFRWAKDNSWRYWLVECLFIRVHRKRSYGGVFG